jgi:hypothetical protein
MLEAQSVTEQIVRPGFDAMDSKSTVENGEQIEVTGGKCKKHLSTSLFVSASHV